MRSLLTHNTIQYIVLCVKGDFAFLGRNVSNDSTRYTLYYRSAFFDSLHTNRILANGAPAKATGFFGEKADKP